jgi:hypothetical protein
MTFDELKAERLALQKTVTDAVHRFEREFGCYVELARFEHVDITAIDDDRRQYIPSVTFRIVLDDHPT